MCRWWGAMTGAGSAACGCARRPIRFASDGCQVLPHCRAAFEGVRCRPVVACVFLAASQKASSVPLVRDDSGGGCGSVCVSLALGTKKRVFARRCRRRGKGGAEQPISEERENTE